MIEYTRHEPDNDKLSWVLSVPTDDGKSNDPEVLEREARSSLAFVMQTLRQVSALPDETLMCVSRQDLFAPAIAQAGMPPGRVIYVEAGDDKSWPPIFLL